jgi:hypothetical protein
MSDLTDHRPTRRRIPSDDVDRRWLWLPGSDTLPKWLARVSSAYRRPEAPRPRPGLDALGARLQRDAGVPEPEIARLEVEARRRQLDAEARLRWI